MKITIHRGARTIGGTCVELSTAKSRIILDLGMPLYGNNGEAFDFAPYKEMSAEELVRGSILPDIPGLYDDSSGKVDGVLVSHAHQDHYGLCSYVGTHVPFYMGRATRQIIRINQIFTAQRGHYEKVRYWTSEQPKKIGDFTIIPFLMDHSAFDAYGLLIEGGGKRLFYTGDFRGHGRKHKVFSRMLFHPPERIDCLLLEGTSVGRDFMRYKSEEAIEKEFTSLFSASEKINLVYTSGQHIDRLVSIYKACLRSEKTLIVDVYVANVLKALSGFANIPFPHPDKKNLRVLYSTFTSRRLANGGHKGLLYQFRSSKITKQEINENPGRYVMIVRPSMQFDIDLITGIDGGNMVWSIWDGYKEYEAAKAFLDYLQGRGFVIHDIHTSGHADIPTLKRLVQAFNPKCIIPIHTNDADRYQKLFKHPVLQVDDGETMSIPDS